MKINKACFFSLPILLIFMTVWIPNVHADASGGGSTAVSVSDVVYSAAEVEALAEKFDAIMAEYGKEASTGRKTELLNKAKDLLTKLIEQANNVESEISILSKKKLDKVYAEKLERILSSILQMRETAQKQMLAANQPG